MKDKGILQQQQTELLSNTGDHSMLSTSVSLNSEAMAEGPCSPNLNMDSITDSSVLVVSNPTNAIQSLTQIPAPINSDPLQDNQISG